MRYIQVTKQYYTSMDVQVQDMKTGNWKLARPILLSPNLKEWFIHTILRKHFTFGQPYCVMCGRSELLTNSHE